jgi:tetratricopeptide (TPR) repeat protein
VNHIDIGDYECQSTFIMIIDSKSKIIYLYLYNLAYTVKLKKYIGLVIKTFPLKEACLLGCLLVTIFLTLIFVGTADTRYKTEDIVPIASQAINSTFVSELIQKGNMLFNKSKYEEAVQSYDQVLMMDPRSIDALNGKGLAFNNLGRYEEAITWFDKAIIIDPTFIHTLNNKGVTLANLGRYEEAITWFDKAIKIDPNFVDALYNKGGALAELGKYEEAIVWTNKALDIDKSGQNASNSKQLILPNE